MNYHIHQLTSQIELPESGKKNLLLFENEQTKVVLFAFAAGAGLAEHLAPMPATIQIITGEARITIANESVAGRAGTWIQMAAATPHSIEAETPLILLLTLLKWVAKEDESDAVG